MARNNRNTLAMYRLEVAKERLESAYILLDEYKYKDAANRAYYCMFSLIRAILAIEAVDFKKHSAVISYFRQHYIKTGIFSRTYSDVIGAAFLVRNQSDYEDFFIVSKEEAKKQCDNAQKFYNAVNDYLNVRVNKE